MIANTPKPPYYAVIFTSIRTTGDNGYSQMAAEMEKLVNVQPGFIGYETAREEIGITVSYWKDLESIKNWKENSSHVAARNKGRDVWYSRFRVRIARVENEYGFEK